ncbi:hypothetical protein WK32_16685 [Burkholderia vietnamiensis]|nr:hypothetical protein WK32_16685 [Burkholderia vietnamiensis]
MAERSIQAMSQATVQTELGEGFVDGFVWQQRASQLKIALEDKSVHAVCQRRYVGDALYPLMHIQLDGVFAEADLDRAVR